MAELWFYTSEGKQQNPVPLAELRRLFGVGVVKPTDMVWRDGMPQWIRASAARELSADAPLRTESAPSGAGVAVALEEPRPARPGPVSRRAPMATGASNAGVVAFLILGALLLLGALGVGIFILIFVVAPTDNPDDFKIKIEGNKLTYKVRVKASSAEDKHWFRFRKGVAYEVSVRSEPRFPDVDLYIKLAGGKELASDTSEGPDSFVRFTPAEEVVCCVELRNLDVSATVVSAVKITPAPTEVKSEPPPVDPAPDQPLPADVKEGKGLETTINVPLGKETTRKFRVRAGHKASFTFIPTGAGPKTDFNLIVAKENDHEQIIAQDIGPEARASVSFTLPATEIVVVRIVNATPKGPNGGAPRGGLSYDVSP